MKRSRQDAAAPAAVSKISAFEPASEEIKFSGPCRVFLKDFDAGEGTVYITTQRIAWLAAGGSRGYAFSYPSITLHGTCRDLEVYPAPCIFAQLDCPALEDEEGDVAASTTSVTTEPDLCSVSEIRLQPPAEIAAVAPAADSAAGDIPPSSASSAAHSAPASALDRMFDAIAECQALHPDEDEDMDGSGGGGQFASMLAMMAGATGAYMGGGDAGDNEEGEGEGEQPVFSAGAMAEMARLEGLLAADLPPSGADDAGADSGEGDAAGPAAGGQFDDA